MKLVLFTTLILLMSLGCGDSRESSAPEPTSNSATLAAATERPGQVPSSTPFSTIPNAVATLPIGTTCPLGSDDTKGNVFFARGDSAQGPFFCIAWRDQTADELGFRVELSYSAGERFVYNVPANTNEFYVPEADQPYFIPWPEPGEACVGCDFRRKDHEVKVYAILPSGEALVGGYAITVG